MLLSLLSKRSLHDDSRDTYGFTVRPQHLHRYREYANIYKEEEAERLQKWKTFLDQQQAHSTSNADDHSCDDDEESIIIKSVVSEVLKQQPSHHDPVSLPVSREGEDDSTSVERHGVPEVTSDPVVEVSVDEGGDSIEQRGEETEVTAEKTEPVDEGGDSVEQIPEENEVTAEKTDPVVEVSAEEGDSSERKVEGSQVTEDKAKPVEKVSEGDDSNLIRHVSDTQPECVAKKEAPTTQKPKPREVKKWAKISPALYTIEQMMSARIKRKNTKQERIRPMHNDLPSIKESEDYNEDVFLDNEGVDDCADASAVESSPRDKVASSEPFFPWKEELEFLVQGGVPKDLRGEVWQAFVGVRTRRVENYYQSLLATDDGAGDAKDRDNKTSGDNSAQHDAKTSRLPEKLRKQIEKDLTRTFPGHPALNENGRNSLRRVLSAYALHNPSVGYCQAMNFFAGLLLLMMPEENAFWTLVGIIDDYFEDYFSEEMTESQVDQLVFEDLMRERFPKLVNHLDYLGMQVAWISGPWFLSIFVNMIPWESVLRVWDVLMFEGNRVMLFRTALALMDLYGPAIVTTKDAGDAITLLQTLAGSTFDSSQLVLTACMGFLTITEDRLQELREKHRPAILAAAEERAKGRVFKDPKGLATKLYSFKHDPPSLVKENKNEAGPGDKKASVMDSDPANFDEYLKSITVDSEVDSLPDLQEQVTWLKVELCRLLEEKRSAILRADELESALMELVEQDNRRELSARVEELEQEVAALKQALSDKRDQENALLQVMMKVEDEQRITEDARLSAEQAAATQKYSVHVLQEKYEKAMATVAQLEKRAVMAESMLEATLQYESGQSKALVSPTEPPKRGLLSFGLGWRDRNKGKSTNDVTPPADTSNADVKT